MPQVAKKQYVKPKVADYGDLVEMTAITVLKKTCPDGCAVAASRVAAAEPRQQHL